LKSAENRITSATVRADSASLPLNSANPSNRPSQAANAASQSASDWNSEDRSHRSAGATSDRGGSVLAVGIGRRFYQIRRTP
jgi:hypothetical protein